MSNTSISSLPGTIFFAETTGHKYAIRVSVLGVYGGEEHLMLSCFKNGNLTGCASGRRRWIELRAAQIIHNEAYCDGINYRISIDTIGVQRELAQADKSTWFPQSKVNHAVLPVAA